MFIKTKPLNLLINHPTAFNSDGIIYDNSPWRPAQGRDLEFANENLSGEIQEPRRRQNLATRIMSNGVGVVVAHGKSAETVAKDSSEELYQYFPSPVKNNGGQFAYSDKTRTKHALSSSPQQNHHSIKSSQPQTNHSLISSSVVTLLHRHSTPPQRHYTQHNFIIKTCLTTYTYLTTFLHNKKTSISTYETIISVISTESLTSYIGATSTAIEIVPTRVIQNNIIKMEQTNYLNKPISSPTSKDKRIENFQNEGSDEQNQDLIQPSEVGPTTTCLTSSCSCSHAKTESLTDKKQKTKYIDNNKIQNDYSTPTQLKRSPLKTSKYGATIMDISPTRLQNGDKNTHYGPYNYENTKLTPADKIVEKYTEVINDSEESVNKNKTPELLTNEQASDENNNNKKQTETKKPEKTKEKPPKINKTKFPVADLLKLGSLGIKSLSQLAPVFEKMTGGFIKRQDDAKSTTTIKPVNKLTQYSNNKKVDSGENIRKAEPKVGNFPIYIPVDEMETSESQNVYANTTLHQNLAWAAEHKHLNSHFKKSIHESPLLNGGIPISPGEIITANSDVIVGKPAVGGPITFNHIVKPNIKVTQANLDLLDSQAEGNIQYAVKERPPKQMSTQKHIPFINDNDSIDLRPPILTPLTPRLPPKDSNFQRHQGFPNKPSNSRLNSYNNQFNTPIRRPQENEMHKHVRPENNGQNKPSYLTNENKAQTVGHIHSQDAFLNNHGRPALLDFIPSLNKPANNDRFEKPSHHMIRKDNEDHLGQTKFNRSVSSHISFESPNAHIQSASAEFDLDKQESDIVLTQVFDKTTNRPFLVDIQPSRVANVLIPHGSSTALIFAGSSEPHKTGDYVDDPLPYPEPGYFGSFSIDAPQMTMVHNVAPTALNKPNFQMNQRKHPPNEIPPRNAFSNTSTVSFQGSSNNKWKNVHKIPQNNHPDFNRLPAPTSNQEINIQVGPHIAIYNPEKHNPTDFDLTKHTYKNNQAGMYKGKPIDREYERHLAVPPPPPPRPNYDTNKGPVPNSQNKNRPLAPKTPTFHTKPIQDMSVFLNIEHPIPHSLSQAFKDGIPQKITSEIYFAAPTPQNIDQIKPFTVHLPANNNNNYKGDKLPNFKSNLNPHHEIRPQSSHTFQYPAHINTQENNVKLLPPKHEIKFPLSSENFDQKDSYGNVHLTSAPDNNNNSDKPQIVGTSIAIPVGSSSHEHLPSNIDTAGIPIGTNVAIKVEANPISFNNYGINGQPGPTGNYFNVNTNNPEIIIGDNHWKAGSIDNVADTHTQTHYNDEHDFVTKNFSVEYPHKEIYSHVENEYVRGTEAPPKKQTINIQIVPSDEVHNSHANFPMIKDSPQIYFNDETSTNKISINDDGSKKRPPKLIPNISTNSHGWFSNIQTESPGKYNLKPHSQIPDSKIKIESTTHKIIPLTHSSAANSNKKQNIFFGNKIPSVGIPPTKLWHQNTEPILNLKEKSLINKIPSNKDKESDFIAPPRLTTQSYNPDYIPGNYGANNQPAYDIPIRDDDHYYSTTRAPTRNTIKVTQGKPVYETADEIFDSLPDQDEPYSDGEISSESMKIPVISSKSNHSVTSTSEKPSTSSKNEITVSSDNEYVTDINESGTNVNFDDNYGMQTEKPFMGTNYNKLPTHSSMDSHSTERNSIPYRDRVQPKPFDVYTPQTKPTTLSHNTHWQINNLAVNNSHKDLSTNLVLNIGEVVRSTDSNKVAFTTEPSMLDTNEDILKAQPISRPTFSLRPVNQTKFNNEQVINTPSRESMIVRNMTSLQPPAQTQTTIEEINNLATEIINLSPPPPTLDYSFQPTHTEETIMGMNPPPPQSSIPSRIQQTLPPPTRTPLVPPPPKTIQQPLRTPAVPVRTLPPPMRTPPPSIRTTPSPIRMPSKPIRTPAPSRNPPQLSRVPISQNRTSTTTRTVPQRTLPPRTLPPRTSPPKTQPPRVSIPLTESEEASTYRPNYDIIKNKTKRPGYVRTKIISRPVTPPTEIKLEPNLGVASISKIVFPTLQSSGWLTPENVHFPDEDIPPSSAPPIIESTATLITSDTSTIKISPSKTIHFEEDHVQFVRPTPVSKMPMPVSKHPVPVRKSTEKPAKLDDNIIVESKPKPVISDKPVHKTPPIYRPTLIIEGSEKVLDDSYLKPTEILKDPTPMSETMIVMTPTIVQSKLKDMPSSKAHPAPSKAIYVDRNIPKPPVEDKRVTKTEIKTIAKTLTKILNEPPTTISTTRFVTLTHTLTVTHTKTSLVSQSAGATTQTLILTNTHTSTVVDVVTEIHTQVKPTTIVETITKHIPITTILPSPVSEPPLKTALDDISMSSEEDNLIHHETEVTTKKIIPVTEKETKDEENESFFVVMNKSQGGGSLPPVNTDLDTQVEFDGAVRDEDVGSNGVSQVLFGEILLAGTPYLEATHVVSPTGAGYGKECQPDCKASRNERCQRMEGLMKCICRPGFARMFPDRPCKPTYTYSMKLALSKYGNKRLLYQDTLADQTSKEFQNLAMATHEGINRMVMQSDLRDVYHGVHINGFLPVEVSRPNATDRYTGVINDFYVQLSDNAHETRLKEVIEKYLRTNNYSLGGTDVIAAGELVDKLDVSDFNECLSNQFNDCSEHAECFNLRGTYTCSCKEGYADLSVNPLYPGRICSAEPVGCERCNYHGACYTRDDDRVLCECFQWYAGESCHVNLKVILISLATLGAILTVLLVICVVMACSKKRGSHTHSYQQRPPPPNIVTSCIQGMPSIHQGGVVSNKQHGTHDRRALITERTNDSGGETSSLQNASLPYMPSKKVSQASSHKTGKKMSVVEMESGGKDKKPFTLMIPRAKYHPPPPTSPLLRNPSERDLRESGAGRKTSMEQNNEAKLLNYLEAGQNNDEMIRRKQSMESSYSLNKISHPKHHSGALISAGFKVSTTIKPDLEANSILKEGLDDDASTINKVDYLDGGGDSRFNTLGKSYSQDDMTEWTDAERRIGELTMSEARSFDGTLVKPPTKLVSRSTCGSNKSSARFTQHEANTMAERDLGSTFLLPHVHLYKPELGSDMSEFDSL